MKATKFTLFALTIAASVLLVSEFAFQLVHAQYPNGNSRPLGMGRTVEVSVIESDDSPTVDGSISPNEWNIGTSYDLLDEAGNQRSPGASITLAHDRTDLFILAQYEADFTDDGVSDAATVCFDTNNDATQNAMADDYCFFVTQRRNTLALTGDGSKTQTSQQIDPPSGLESSAGFYNGHAIYEFKIPLDFIGHKSQFGFALFLHDFASNNFSVPYDILAVGSGGPTNWALLVSPDKTMPEFPVAIFASALAIGSSIIFLAFRHRLRV